MKSTKPEPRFRVLCGICQKTVDRFTQEYDSLLLQWRVFAHCHGRNTVVKVDRHLAAQVAEPTVLVFSGDM